MTHQALVESIIESLLVFPDKGIAMALLAPEVQRQAIEKHEHADVMMSALTTCATRDVSIMAKNIDDNPVVSVSIRLHSEWQARDIFSAYLRKERHDQAVDDLIRLLFVQRQQLENAAIVALAQVFNTDIAKQHAVA